MPRIPLSLSWNPITTKFSAADINQFGQLFVKQVAGELDQASITSFASGSVNPDTNQGLFYNTTAQMFMVWDVAAARYKPMNGYTVGDTKQSFKTGDEISTGWVQLDGRQITNVPGISTSQRASLIELFPTGQLPVLTNTGSLLGLPANGAIAGISIPDIDPANGVIGNLPIGTTYSQGEVTAIKDGAETLRDSTDGLAESVRKLRDKTEAIRDALAGTGAPSSVAVFKVFCGYP